VHFAWLLFPSSFFFHSHYWILNCSGKIMVAFSVFRCHDLRLVMNLNNTVVTSPHGLAMLWVIEVLFLWVFVTACVLKCDILPSCRRISVCRRNCFLTCRMKTGLVAAGLGKLHGRWSLSAFSDLLQQSAQGTVRRCMYSAGYYWVLYLIELTLHLCKASIRTLNLKLLEIHLCGCTAITCLAAV